VTPLLVPPLPPVAAVLGRATGVSSSEHALTSTARSKGVK
jgi:hypothetical protein